MTPFVITLGIASIMALWGFVIRSREKSNLHYKNDELFLECLSLIGDAFKWEEKYRDTFVQLQAITPPPVWRTVEDKQIIPVFTIQKILQSLARDNRYLKGSATQLRQYYEFLSNLRQELLAQKDAAEKVRECNSQLLVAAHRCKSLMNKLSVLFAEVQREVCRPGVGERARECLRNANVYFQQEQEMMNTPRIDWFTAESLLLQVEEYLGEAHKAAAKDLA